MRSIVKEIMVTMAGTELFSLPWQHIHAHGTLHQKISWKSKKKKKNQNQCHFCSSGIWSCMKRQSDPFTLKQHRLLSLQDLSILKHEDIKLPHNVEIQHSLTAASHPSRNESSAILLWKHQNLQSSIGSTAILHTWYLTSRLFLSWKLKVCINRHLSESVEEMQEKTLAQLTKISSELYMECWDNSEHQWNHCINEGECSVWDNVQSNLPSMHRTLFSQSETFWTDLV